MTTKKKEVDSFTTDCAKSMEAQKDLKEKIKDKGKILFKAPPLSTAAANTGSKRKLAKNSGKQPSPGDDELMTEDTARQFCPKSCVLYKDYYNKRWIVAVRSTRLTRSRSWEYYGDMKSLCLVLQFAWEQHFRACGEDCPYEFVKRIATGV